MGFRAFFILFVTFYTVDPTALTATGIARRIKHGDLSPLEIVEEVLERIHARNDRTNAFVTITDDLAREMAADAERAIEEGEHLGPLHGVPVAIKDLDDVEGVRTTYGSVLFNDHVATSHSPVVSRLIDAGAIVVGKTNTPEFGVGTTTDNLVVGPAGTPFDPDRISGGSSGGAGAALADSLVPLASGSDVGGSIRVPSSCCGVYGLKPTFGLVPHVDRPGGFSAHTPFFHKGPMTRTVEDAALALDVMAGTHPRDPFSVPAAEGYRDAVNQPIDDLEIAVSPGMGIYPLEPDVRKMIEDAASLFERAGASVKAVDPEFSYNRNEILEAYYTMAASNWQDLLDGLETKGFDPRGEDWGELRPYLRELITNAGEPTREQLRRASVVRTSVFDDLTDLFAKFDLFASATIATTPFPHGEEPTEIDGNEVEPYRGWVLTQPYNFSGHPAASIPAGIVDGLPVGMQLAGRRHEDDVVLAASAAFERQKPWHGSYSD